MRMFKSLICWSVAFIGSEAILAPLNIDLNIFGDPSLPNIGNFAIRLGVVLGLYFLTDWLLGRLPYFSNKRGD